MRILLDNDVVQDFVQQRSPFESEANEIFARLKRKEFDVYVAPITPVNVFYVLRKLKGRDIAFQAVENLLKAVEVCNSSKTVSQKALTVIFSDYEDAVQYACALSENLDAVVTRNLRDYKISAIPVYSPTDFLKLLQTS